LLLANLFLTSQQKVKSNLRNINGCHFGLCLDLLLESLHLAQLRAPHKPHALVTVLLRISSVAML
jgi:hypothetical protein